MDQENADHGKDADRGRDGTRRGARGNGTKGRKGAKSPVPLPAPAEVGLDAVLDRALAIQRPLVLAYLDRIHRREPGLTPKQLVSRLERQYQTTVAGIGGAAGAAAFLPGVGTAASLAAGAAEIAAFVSASAMFVLALAELHGVPVSDPDVRRALVLSVLLGEGGEAALEGLRRGEAHWAHIFTRRGGPDKDTLSGLNGRLGKVVMRRFGARQGVLLFGRAAPLGVGAVIGAVGNTALARQAISAARTAFGPPPAQFPPRVIDVIARPPDTAG